MKPRRYEKNRYKAQHLSWLFVSLNTFRRVKQQLIGRAFEIVCNEGKKGPEKFIMDSPEIQGNEILEK